jgi:hypothetical protein
MLNALVQHFGGKPDRRTADRIRQRFPLAWIKDGTTIPAQGLEISEKGVLFATKDASTPRNVDVVMDLNGRRVRARLTIVRTGSMTRDNVTWTLLAGVFQGIAADDWDAIVRFCKRIPDAPNKAAEELASLAGTDDDAYRLLPLKVQERVVATLVAAGRLAPDSNPQNPLLRMSYGGKTKTGGHLLRVRSRRLIDEEPVEFESSLHVDDAGNVHLDR